MASVSANIHLRDDDAPYVDRLEGGHIAVWLEGKHRGPTLMMTDKALTNLLRALARFDAIPQAVTTEAA